MERMKSSSSMTRLNKFPKVETGGLPLSDGVVLPFADDDRTRKGYYFHRDFRKEVNIMELKDAKKLGFLTETEEAEERKRMNYNWELYRSLKKAGKREEAKEAFNCITIYESELEMQKMTVRYIDNGVRMRESSLSMLPIVKQEAKKFDGKVYNKTFSEKITEALKKFGDYRLSDWKQSEYTHKILLISYEKYNTYDVDITWDFEKCLYVKNGQVKPRFCFEKFAELVDSAESIVKREIARLENARDEKSVNELQNEITATVKKLESLQKKARDTYDETAVKNVYRWVNRDFFGR